MLATRNILNLHDIWHRLVYNMSGPSSVSRVFPASDSQIHYSETWSRLQSEEGLWDDNIWDRLRAL